MPAGYTFYCRHWVHILPYCRHWIHIMGPRCLQSISYLIFVSWIHILLLTLDTYLGLSIIEYMYPGYTYCFRPWIHIMGSCLQSVPLNTCTMDIHTAVDPGCTLWASDVFKLYLLYIYLGYTYYCRPWIHILGSSCLQSVSLNTCTLGIHTALDPGYTLWAAVFKVYH